MTGRQENNDGVTKKRLPSRRLNSEGTITKRSDGRWEARVSLPDGKRKSFYGKTQKEVQRKLTQARRDIDDGLLLVDERQSFEHYLLDWLETTKLRVDPSSWDRYETQVRYHIIPGLGKYSLAKISAQQIQVFYATLSAKGLSSATIQNIHAVISGAFKDALKLGLVQRPIMHLVQVPKLVRRQMVVLSEEQVPVFLQAISGERLESLYILALATGMRRCELLALRWHDVDLDQATLQVRFALQRQHGKFTPAAPKSDYSRRRIALSPLVVDSLRAHRIRQQKEILVAGSAWHPDLDLVFPTTTGKHIFPTVLSDHDFHRVLEKANLNLPLRFHDLRHTAATLLIARGVNPKIVSEMLGHSDISITLRVYAHVTPHMQQLAAEVMDTILRRPVSG